MKTIAQLRPGTRADLVIKVVETIKAETKSSRVAECIVGDSSGCCVFLAVGDQVDQLQPGHPLVFRNIYVEVRGGRMVLVSDQWSLIQPLVDPAPGAPLALLNNVSMVQHERVAK